MCIILSMLLVYTQGDKHILYMCSCTYLYISRGERNGLMQMECAMTKLLLSFVGKFHYFILSVRNVLLIKIWG